MERFFLACTLLVISLACNSGRNDKDLSGESNNSDGPPQVAEIILRAETDEIVYNPARITSFDDGFILYDDALKQIHVFSENGVRLNTFGGEGRGPGEFQAVSTLKVDEGQVIVSDPELLRVTGFDLQGNVNFYDELPASLFAIDNAILAPGQFIAPTNGREGGLVRFVDVESGLDLFLANLLLPPRKLPILINGTESYHPGKYPIFSGTE